MSLLYVQLPHNKMTFSIPIFISTLAVFFILPFFSLIYQGNEKKRALRIHRTVLDIESLAMNGWILITNRYSNQCSELIKDLHMFKKKCKEEKKVFLPIYDVTFSADKEKLLESTGKTLLHCQLKGDKPLNIFLPIIYNVESQLYTSLPFLTSPNKLWRTVFELEKTELLHRDPKIDKYKRENLEDDANETDDEINDKDEVESNSSIPDSLPDLVASGDSENGEEDEDGKEDEDGDEDEEKRGQRLETTSNFLFKEILKLHIF